MMQTDVQVSAVLASTGQFLDQAATGRNILRCRIKAIYMVCAAGAGSVVIRDGGSGGSVVGTFNTPAGATLTVYLKFPGEGLLCNTNVHGTVTNVTSTIIFYG